MSFLETLVVENVASVLPVILTVSDGPLTDEQFQAFCEQYPDYQLEATADGELILMPPNYARNDERNGELIMQLKLWAKRDGRGRVFGPTAGFRLNNGAWRAPDACWVPKTRIAKLPANQQATRYHLTPDFVVEIRSTERLSLCRKKMQEYVDNGSELGWLIDPQNSTVTIYRQGHAPLELIRPKEVHGEGPVAGFVLDTTDIFD